MLAYQERSKPLRLADAYGESSASARSFTESLSLEHSDFSIYGSQSTSLPLHSRMTYITSICDYGH